MPVVEVEAICQSETRFAKVAVQQLADALGHVFGNATGRTWVKLRFLGSQQYAENETVVQVSGLPVFVSVRHPQLPQSEALDLEAKAITAALAQSLGSASKTLQIHSLVTLPTQSKGKPP